MGLIIYVTSFLVVTGVVAGVTSFFYSNSMLMTEELYSAADYNKLNLYLVKESEQEGNRVKYIEFANAGLDESKDAYSLSFTNGDKFTFEPENHLLYYNNICICEDVQRFKANTEYTYGKEVMNIMIGFTNKSYSCKYTMMQ